jgi:hypothetical protein
MINTTGASSGARNDYHSKTPDRITKMRNSGFLTQLEMMLTTVWNSFKKQNTKLWFNFNFNILTKINWLSIFWQKLQILRKYLIARYIFISIIIFSEYNVHNIYTNVAFADFVKRWHKPPKILKNKIRNIPLRKQFF